MEVANPALDDFLHRDALRATLPPKMRENAFRRYRLGQWVGADAAWLPDGAWAGAADAPRSIPDGAEVALAFDGSFNGDTTVLVVATVDQRPHIDLVELWEAAGRQVPIVDVEQAIGQACRRWRVLEIAADPFTGGRGRSSSSTARGCRRHPGQYLHLTGPQPRRRSPSPPRS